MRQITNCNDNEITLEGEGIKYTISRSTNIIPKIEIEPELMTDIEKKFIALSRIDTRSKGTASAFIGNLKKGRLTLKERGGFGWFNSWCYTPSTESYGNGHDMIKSLEKTIFGFEIGERIWGEKNGERINPGPDYIFNLASKIINKNFGQ